MSKTATPCRHATPSGVVKTWAYLCAYCGGWHRLIRPKGTN